MVMIGGLPNGITGPLQFGEFVDRVATIPGIKWPVAVVILIVGYYLSILFVQALGRPVARRFKRPSVVRTVLRGIRALLIVAAIIAALTVLEVGLGNIVLSVTVFSAVVGLILAPIIGSVINGLFVLADQPYEVGDLIELRDIERRGYVEDITLRYTKIFTLDNTFLVLSNSVIRERDVVNYSAEDERTRLRLSVLVTYESDISEARQIMEAAATNTPNVIDGGPNIRIGSARYPAAPQCYFSEYGDHGVLLTLRYWVKSPYHIERTRSRVHERVWTALEESNVTIAYPHSHLVFDETSGRVPVDVAGINRPD